MHDSFGVVAIRSSDGLTTLCWLLVNCVDQNIVGQIANAGQNMRRWCENGIRASYESEPLSFLAKLIESESISHAGTAVVHLSPNGHMLGAHVF